MDGAGSLAGPRGAICLGNCRISVSKHCTSCCEPLLGREVGVGKEGCQRHTCGSSGFKAKVLGSRKRQPGSRTGGEVFNTVLPSSESSFWLVFISEEAVNRSDLDRPQLCPVSVLGASSLPPSSLLERLSCSTRAQAQTGGTGQQKTAPAS